jgi:hypothetical protein
VCTFQVAKPPENIYEQFITVETGKDGNSTQRFPVCRALLCHQSGYFLALLNGRFAESGSDVVRLRDTEGGIFKIFLRWLYSGSLRALGHAPPKYIDLFQLYRFGDFYVIPRLKNAITDLCLWMRHHRYGAPKAAALEYLYDETERGCPIQKLIIDIAVDRSDLKVFDDRYPPEFLVDVCQIIGTRKRPMPSHKADRNQWYEEMKVKLCNYHDHIEPRSADLAASIAI